MREAIEFHLEGMHEDGDPLPEPSTTAAVIDVAA
jgi:predicted RNase H-like HicB family nuclease